MATSDDFRRRLNLVDFSNQQSIFEYSSLLPGMTFRDVLDLGITPPGKTVDLEYDSTAYKGGLGVLLEERYFGYPANNDDRPDFHEAGLELKATCYDQKKNKEISAGERLVLSMIPYDREVSDNLYESHLWTKLKSILLIDYWRDKKLDRLDQKITHTTLFTPPKEDLAVLEEDYRTIISYIKTGRADELSESLTSYLGACTKGATAAKSWVEQYYPRMDEDGVERRHPAKKRAFCLKRQYMDYLLHTLILKEADNSESLLGGSTVGAPSFEKTIEEALARYIGKTDRKLCELFGLRYTGNKAQWTTLVYRILGIKNNKAKEFIKAGISVRVVRVEEKGRIKESLSLSPFKFKDLASETWEDSALRSYFDETRFFFVVFKKVGGTYQLAGCTFWNMSHADLEGPVKRCWRQTHDAIVQGLQLDFKPQRNGSVVIENNLPGSSDNPICHIRPHASQRAYRIPGCRDIGNIARDANELPDGRWMTTQSFWLNSGYLEQVLRGLIDPTA